MSGPQRFQPKASKQQRMLWQPKRRQRAKNIVVQVVPALGKRPDQLAISPGILSEQFGSLLNRTFQHNRAAIVQGVSQWRVLLDKLKPKVSQRQTAQERRTQAQRMDRGTYIVDKAWQRQFRRTSAAADGWFSFADLHGPACLRQRDRRRQPI